GHGRREQRGIETSTALPAHLATLGWSSVRQVFRLVRQRQQHDPATGVLTTTREHVDGITLLSREQADAAQVAACVRAHWKIENQLPDVRDVTFNEDACRIRTGHGPQQLALARNAAIAICRLNNHPNLAAARRDFAWNPRRIRPRLGLVTN
ncbi:MAG: ISAs1 family transposase, partial [Planctomycetaceae bacterium]|nr:ISAs1 family transposase [Planctomycetaceae bacterium]